MKLELLAPSGDIDSFYSAIYNGADAVYLGMSDFNARIKAVNFNTENIVEVVNFAHLYGTKVYLTVNTLIKDEEIDKFLQVIDVAINAKIDAFIIQDLGMAMLLKQNYKNIVLHASTQMGIHNLKGAKFLENLGFSRVILSRESKIEDIKDIRENTKLEIEFFIQGSLCVAFSGNCYLSSLKNGNSGNRGKCLQLCRLPYTATVNSNTVGKGYFLSPSDLCLIENLDMLSQAGVTSFKIEGRLKRPSYIAQTVKSYRKAIDCLTENKRFDVKKEIEEMKAIFSRGEFNTNAYLNNNKKIINEKQQDHEGTKIGEVVKVEPFKDLYRITIKSKYEIKSGDGLKLVSAKGVSSLGVGNVNRRQDLYQIFSTRYANENSEVYLTLNSEKEKELTNFKKFLPINMFFEAKLGKNPILKIKYRSIEVIVKGENECEKATSQPLNEESVLKQMSKVLDSQFRLETLKSDLDSVFISLSSLNAIRREGVEKLEKAIIEDYNKKTIQVEKISSINSINLLGAQRNENTTYLLIDNVEQLKTFDLKDDKFAIIYSPLIYSLENIKNFQKNLKSLNYLKIFYINLPIIAEKNEVEFIDNIFNNLYFKFGVVANNYWALNYINKFPVIAGIGLNIYNKNTAVFYKNLGVEDFVYSIESSPFLGSEGVEYTYGNPPLMTFCHCPFSAVSKKDCKNCSYCKMNYKDEKENLYNLRRYKIINCYFELVSDEKINKSKSDVKQLMDLR